MEADVRAMFSRPWAIEPAHGCAFIQALSDCIKARNAGASQDKKKCVATAADSGGVRALSMRGPMLFRAPAWLADWGIEYCDTLGLADQIRAADADPAVSRIVIHADTPGGMVGGVPELSDAIAATCKPVEVRVDGMLASAGVWAACQADRITATRSSEIGSIGVYTVRVDTSQALSDQGIRVYLVSSGGVKGAGADGKVTPELLAEDARIVGQLRDQFVSAVSSGRGRDLSARATGQVWLSADALRIGLIDCIESTCTPNDQTEESDTMDIAPLAAIAAKHPAKAAEILKLAGEGKTDSEIELAMKESAHADAIAIAEKSASDSKAHAEKLAADLKAEQEKSSKLAADLADLKAKLEAAEKSQGKIAQLASGAPKDPGDDSSVAPKEITRAEFERNPAAYSAKVAAGQIKVK